ncbi:MAG: hypothetical protein ABSD64_08015 [Terriglobales bacterium]|jgi:ribosomal protein L40E
MPSNRPNLMLDEQSFQGLLAAAFTIQQHNDWIRRGWQTAAESAARSATEDTSACPDCGAPMPAETQRCQSCGLDELRPGERLQHNWASMWLMSQEQGSWPDHPLEVGEAAATIREDAKKPVSIAAECGPLTDSAHDFAHDATFGKTRAETLHPTTATEDFNAEDLPPEESGLTVRTFALSASGDSHPIEGTLVGTTRSQTTAVHDRGTRITMGRLADFRGQLRRHRADLYLGAAVVVAAVALLWPAADSPRRAALRPWERALVTLGIAETAAPVTHFQGDPGVKVWVDSHSALYYCPGEEQYGKTVDGRFSSQRDAQMDRFEPAGRSACE